jgi:hypothetical protein
VVVFEANGAQLGSGELEIRADRAELMIEDPQLVERLQKQHHTVGGGLVLRLRLSDGQFGVFSATGYLGPTFFGDVRS